MSDKTYKLSEAQRIIIHDALNHVISKGLFRPGYAQEFAEVFGMFQTEHSVGADPVLPRYDPRFTEQDLSHMFAAAADEGSDLGRRELAELVMDSWDIVSCIAACSILADQHSCEDLAQMLKHLDTDNPDYVNGEFLRLNDDDGDNYAGMLDFAKRMKLINEEETELTDIGREYMESLI